MTLADLNGDGYFVGGKPGKGPHVPTPSFVCLNDGEGHFPACETLPTESATSIVAEDLDRDGAIDLDGRLDLAIIDEQKRAAFAIFNRGRRRFGDF